MQDFRHSIAMLSISGADVLEMVVLCPFKIAIVDKETK